MTLLAEADIRQDNQTLELSIVMPCLNESRTVGTCVRKAAEFLKHNGIAGEVIVADNGSTDGSQKIAASLGAQVVHVPLRGYGNALRTGIAAARGQFVIMGDSDDSYDFTRLEAFVRELRNGCDLVLGNRFAGGIAPGAMPPLHRYFGNPLLTQIGRALYGNPSRDFYCGLRGFRRDAVMALDLDAPGMEFALEMVVKAAIRRLRIVEVPTTLSPDGRDRRPHLRTWRDGWRSLRFFLLLSPRTLFLYPGLIIFAVGLVLTLILLVTDVRVDGIVFTQKTLIVAAAAVNVGFQAILFWAFAKVVAMQRGLLRPDATFERLRRTVPLELGLFIGSTLVIVGAAAIVAALGYWGSLSFGPIERDFPLRLVCGGSAALMLGMQVVFGSFFLFLLEYRGTCASR